jgi:hypothetical protein
MRRGRRDGVDRGAGRSLASYTGNLGTTTCTSTIRTIASAIMASTICAVECQTPR